MSYLSQLSQSVSQSTVSQSVDSQSVSQSVDSQSVSRQSVSQSVDSQSVSRQSVSQSVDSQSVSQSVSRQSVSQSVDSQSVSRQSVSQSVSQSVNKAGSIKTINLVSRPHTSYYCGQLHLFLNLIRKLICVHVSTENQYLQSVFLR